MHDYAELILIQELHYVRINKFWVELNAYFPWYHTARIENDASNNSSVVAYVFVTAVTFFTEVLPGNDKGKHKGTQTDRRDLWCTPLRWA
jgi:hypothetical protein